mgnify:CR=1 FL=1
MEHPGLNKVTVTLIAHIYSTCISLVLRAGNVIILLTKVRPMQTKYNPLQRSKPEQNAVLHEYMALQTFCAHILNDSCPHCR